MFIIVHKVAITYFSYINECPRKETEVMKLIVLMRERNEKLGRKLVEKLSRYKKWGFSGKKYKM